MAGTTFYAAYAANTNDLLQAAGDARVITFGVLLGMGIVLLLSAVSGIWSALKYNTCCCCVVSQEFASPFSPF